MAFLQVLQVLTVALYSDVLATGYEYLFSYSLINRIN